MAKIKVPNLKDNFGSEIIERGRKYYQQDRVRSLVVDGDSVAAIVIGSRNYRVRMNLDAMDFKCTCPYGANCKHMVAVLMALKDKKFENEKYDLANVLNGKSKEELIEIVRKMIISEPALKKIIYNSAKDIKQRIENLKIADEEDIDSFVDEVDQLYDEAIKGQQKIENAVSLFKKCFSFYSEYGAIEPLEESMFIMLNKISKEAKKLPKKERKILLQELVDLTREYDFFWDSIDDNDIKINY